VDERIGLFATVDSSRFSFGQQTPIEISQRTGGGADACRHALEEILQIMVMVDIVSYRGGLSKAKEPCVNVLVKTHQ
jgi:hypothetical protein